LWQTDDLAQKMVEGLGRSEVLQPAVSEQTTDSRSAGK
jgi:hypothetical protein